MKSSILWRIPMKSLTTKRLLGVGVLVVVSASLLSWRLVQLVGTWQASGDHQLPIRMTQIGLFIALAVGVLSAFGFLRQAFGDQAGLLMTFPLKPALRFRSLSGLVCMELIHIWATTLISLTLVLWLTTGPQALWLLVPIIPACLLALWLAVVTVLLVAGWFPTNPHYFIAVPLGGGIAAAFFSGLEPSWTMVAESGFQIRIATLLTLIVFICFGPLATPMGRLYETVYYRLQERAPGVRNRKIMRFLLSPTRRHRNPTMALVVRGMINRSRNTVGPIELGGVLTAAFFFPQLHDLVDHLNPDGSFWVLVFLCLTVLYLVFDACSSPMGGEGNRLALYMSMPLPVEKHLDARYLAFLLPFLLPCIAAAPILGWSIGLELSDVLPATIAFFFWLSGMAALFAYGSAWDADMDMEINTGIMALLQEEQPFTPKRMALLMFAFPLTTLQLLLVWQTPIAVWLPTLWIANLGFWFLCRGFGLKQMARLVI